ncbi:glutamate receptor 1-like isoform X2 [Oscarella lobularis]|uniref:glutamate receptor 1-like isoform X2 n=1 Tax=Oscarella lobularis TaxID=121494 RepID=UPI003313943E
MMQFSILPLVLLSIAAADITVITPSDFLDDEHLNRLLFRLKEVSNQKISVANSMSLDNGMTHSTRPSHFAATARLLVASVLGNFTLGFENLILSQMETAVALAVEKRWHSIAYFSDNCLKESVYEGFLEKSFSVLFTCFDHLTIFSNIDAVFVVCLTPTDCYRRFVDLFHQSIQSLYRKPVAWILSDNVASKVEEDSTFWRDDMDNTEIYSINRRLLNTMEIERLNELYEGLRSSRKTLTNSADLYQAVLSTKQLPYDSYSAFQAALETRKKKRLSYDVYQLDQSSKDLIGKYDEGELHLIGSARRRRRDVSTCLPAVRGKDGRYHFVVSVIEEVPYIMVQRNNLSEIISISGAVVDALTYLSKELNFSFEMKLAPDGTPGQVFPNSSSGIVGEVYNCRADLGAGALTITPNREKYVEFTMPCTWTTFLQPFNLYAWVTVLLTLVVATLSIPLISFLSAQNSPDSGNAQSDETKDPLGKKLINASWYFLASAFSQSPSNAGQIPTKILLLGWYFLVLIIVSTYTANLAAFLTYPTTITPINSIAELSAQSDISYGTVANSTVESFFMQSQLQINQRVASYLRLNPQSMVSSVQEGVARVKNASEPYVFIWESPTLYYYVNQKPCNARLAGKAFHLQGYGIAMPKGMPYRKDFSVAVLKFRESQELLDLRSYWNVDICGILLEADSPSVGSVGPLPVFTAHILGPFVFLIICPLGISLLVALLQRLFAQKSNQDGNNP